MRGTFIKTLAQLAETDDRILLLTGDLGYMAIEPFADQFPGRFINAGVAEQNMVGVATGLAEAGFIPFVYSIATFASLRPYEFIRNGAVMHNLPVRIVGVGGGFEYGLNGLTHFSLEDLGMMRMQPNLTVIAPADYAQTRSALLATWEMPGPIYYRVGKDDESLVPGLKGQFDLERVASVRAGGQVLLVSMGAISLEAVKAADQLSASGISCSVAVVSTLNPVPYDDLLERLKSHSRVFTVESHYAVGGVGSLVSEIVAEQNLACQVTRLGIRELPANITGSQDYLNRVFGISSQAIVKSVQKALI